MPELLSHGDMKKKGGEIMSNNVAYGKMGLDESFSNIAELESKILSLHKFDKVQIKTEVSKDWEARFRGIWNKDLDRLAGVVTQDYMLVQHTEAFLPMLQVLRNIGLTNVSGRMGQDLRRAYLFIQVDDPRATFEIKLPNGKKDKVQMSIILKHGMDGSLALWGTIGAYRVVCSNGMIVGSIYKTVRKVHRGKETNLMLESFYEGLVKGMIDNSVRLSDLIQRSFSEMIKQSMAEAVLYGMGFGRNYVIKILEKCQKYDTMYKWDLYNAITEYITHEVEKASFQKRVKYLNQANKLFTEDLNELVTKGTELIPVPTKK